jgi:hypothetical protein
MEHKITGLMKCYELFLITNGKILHTSMVVLAPGSVHARPFAQPPINKNENLSANMTAKSPSEIISEVLKT